jgi:hypothetical protein
LGDASEVGLVVTTLVTMGVLTTLVTTEALITLVTIILTRDLILTTPATMDIIMALDHTPDAAGVGKVSVTSACSATAAVRRNSSSRLRCERAT